MAYNPIEDPAINPFRNRNTGTNTELIKRFVTPQKVTSGGGNGVTSLDDPTYLGFTIRFDPFSPLFNGAQIGEPLRPPAEDTLLSRIGGAVGELLSVQLTDPAAELGGSKLTTPAGQSAVGYLKAVGEYTRASYLQSFVQGMSEVNTYRPYYWQSIEGLVEAWQKSNKIIEPFTGSAEGEGIKIGCLEAIDLKISALFNLYRGAVLDNQYQRFVLPKNLMYFNVYVDVFEIRNFKSTINFLDKIVSGKTGSPLPETDVDLYLNENTSRITFKFSDCVWDLAESGGIFEGVTNAGGNEMAKTAMKWSYNRIEFESQFSGYDNEIKDGAKQKKGNLRDFVLDKVKDAAQIAANSALERTRQAASARVKGLLLGNVFGLRNQVFSALQNPGALSAAIAGAATLIRRRGAKGPALGDNALGDPKSIPGSLPTGNLFAGEGEGDGLTLEPNNIFGPRPSGPPPLNSTNIFG